MKPPRCVVCNVTLHDVGDGSWRDHFRLVSFTDYSYVPGRAGSTRGVLWFCTEHTPLGEARTHLTSGEALDDLRASHI